MTNEQQLERFADLMGPVAEIFTDEELRNSWGENSKVYEIASAAIKRHKQAVIQILAIMDGVPVDEYIVPPPAQLLFKLLSFFNDSGIKDLFTGQPQKTE